MMNKKKIITLATAVIVVVMAVTGATLAYFKDTDQVKNTLAIGSVEIELIEQERIFDEDGEVTLEDFTQNKSLYPIVGTVDNSTIDTEYAMPDPDMVSNYVDKMVTIENTGSADAYVRAYIAIPAALDSSDDVFEQEGPGHGALRFDLYNRLDADANWSRQTDSGEIKSFKTTIDGIAYNVYYADYTEILAPDETTTRFFDGLYLDSSFEIDRVETVDPETGKTVTSYKCSAHGAVLEGAEQFVTADGLKVTCPVFAVAAQAKGFTGASQAINTVFGAQFNPWGGTVTDWH